MNWTPFSEWHNIKIIGRWHRDEFPFPDRTEGHCDDHRSNWSHSVVQRCENFHLFETFLNMFFKINHMVMQTLMLKWDTRGYKFWCLSFPNACTFFSNKFCVKACFQKFKDLTSLDFSDRQQMERVQRDDFHASLALHWSIRHHRS